MDEKSKSLLTEIFIASSSYSGGVEAIQFRAKHHKYLALLDKLKEENLLEIRNEKYFLKLIALKKISDSTQQVDSLLFLCEHLFGKLRSHYLNSPGKSILIDDLSTLADLPKRKVIIGISYMVEAPIFGGYSTDLKAQDAQVQPSESILKYNSFNHVIETLENWQKKNLERFHPTNVIESTLSTNQNQYYVDPSRIEELKLIQTVDFDLKRVVRICEELNSCHENSNYFAIACLVRTILNHIPPIFGFNTFKEVANNYGGGGKSLKQSFKNLENSSRKISDSILHQTIRRSESLPTKVMVNFSNDVDVLLSEILRILS